jgi:hypothetical protein
MHSITIQNVPVQRFCMSMSHMLSKVITTIPIHGLLLTMMSGCRFHAYPVNTYAPLDVGWAESSE